MTFKEIREAQRIAETSHLGPGATGDLKPFGSDLKNIDFGRKYEFKPKEGPGVGQYDAFTVNSIEIVKPRSKYHIIHPDLVPKKNKKEPTPAPGQYDKHLKPFGSDLPANATMGSKYVFKPDSNPPVGAYDIDSSKELVSSRSKAALIREEVSPYRRPKEETPAPGTYDSHLKPFGSELKHSASMGSKYIFKPDSNPPVGAYEAEKAKDAISFRNK